MGASSASRSRPTREGRRSSKSTPSRTSKRQAVSPGSSGRPKKHLSFYDQLDDEQKKIFHWTIDRPHAGLLVEQGIGKTWITAAVIEHSWYDSFEGLIVVPLTNKETTWFKLLESRFACYRDWDEYREADAPKLLILHYEAISKKLVKKLRRHHFSLICYDESQRLKQRMSQQSRIAKSLSAVADRRMILTGTPIEQRPQDVWAQMRFLDPSVLGTRWEDFTNEWLEPIDIDLSKYDPASVSYQRMFIAYMRKKRKQKFLEDRLPEFVERLAPYLLRVEKADALNLKPVRHINVPVRLLGSQRAIYEALEGDFVTELEHRRITAGMKAVRIGKLQQVAGGWVKADDRGILDVGRAKLRKVLALANRVAKPFVVCCRYTAEVNGIAKALRQRGFFGATLDGKVKAKTRVWVQEQFQLGNFDFLVCQQRTGGVGIDLFRAHVLILYSLTFSSIDYEQMIARLHRRGQTEGVEIYSVFAQNTVDEDVAMSLIQKHKVVDQVLSGLKWRVKHRG